MFDVVDARKLGDKLFRGFTYISLALALLAACVPRGLAVTSSVIAINLAFAWLNTRRRYRELPGQIVLAFFLLIYFQLPIVYMTIARDYYDFAASVAIPQPSRYYQTYFVPAIWFYFATHLCLLAGMLLGRGRTRRSTSIAAADALPSEGWPSKRLTMGALMLGALVVTMVSLNDLASIFSAQALRAEKAENIIALIFNDRMYQLLFPVLFYLVPLSLNRRLTKAQFALGAALFLAINLASTSKGALLAVGVSFFVYPAAIYYQRPRPVYFPTKKILAGTLLMSMPLYFVAMLSRQVKMIGGSMTFDSLRAAVSDMAADADSSIAFLDAIVTRLSVSINNFVLVFTECRTLPRGYRQEFLLYLFHSFLNLTLPGTPYPQAYMLSSQQFPNVIAHAPLYGDVSKADFLQLANTQPYTLFGVLFVLGGPALTVVAAFLAGWAFVIALRLLKSALNRTLVVFTFMTCYACYGIEAAAQFCIITWVTAYFVMGLVSLGGYFKRQRHASIPMDTPLTAEAK